MGCNSTFWPNPHLTPKEVFDAIEASPGVSEFEIAMLKARPDDPSESGAHDARHAVWRFMFLLGREREGYWHAGYDEARQFYVCGGTSKEYLAMIREIATRIGGVLKTSDCASQDPRIEKYRGWFLDGVGWHFRRCILEGKLKGAGDWDGLVAEAKRWERAHNGQPEQVPEPNLPKPVCSRCNGRGTTTIGGLLASMEECSVCDGTGFA